MLTKIKTTEEKLLHAQETTLRWFEAVEKNNLIRPGKYESQLVSEMLKLGEREFGITEHWHKKIIRSGLNTLATYSENPADRMIGEGDIVFLDFGPIINGYEADLGRTYVLGNDPDKLRAKQDVEKAWYEIWNWYKQHTTLKASDMYCYILEKASAYGWTFTGDIAGHIVGMYPHEQPADPKSPELDIHPANHNDIFLCDANGNKRHWVLELQFINMEKEFGAYFEQLL